MIAKIFIVVTLIGALSCAPEVKDPPKVDLQKGKPGTVVTGGVVIPLGQQVPGPKPAKQRRSVYDELPEHPRFRRDTSTPKVATPSTKDTPPKSPATLTRDIPKTPSKVTRDVPKPVVQTKVVPKTPAQLTKDAPKVPPRVTKEVLKPAVVKP